jgi:hypothetical protein
MAYDGELYQRDRVGQGKDKRSVTVPTPALTLCCAVQPEVLDDLKNKEMLTAEGVLGRCCFVQPPSLVGSRNPHEQTPLDDQAYLAYEMSIQRLLEVDDRELTEVKFNDDAVDELINFVWKVEQELNPLRSYASIPEWALKAGGRVARIAALQTMVERALEAESDEAIFAPIEVAAVRDAIRIVEALATHARYTLGVMGADKHTKLMQYVLDKRLELGPDATVRDLLKACRRFQTKDELDPLAEELEEMGYFKLKPIPSAGTGGRPPSPRVLVNPRYLRDKCAKTPDDEGSVSFGTDEDDDYEEIERLAIQQEGADGLPF